MKNLLLPLLGAVLLFSYCTKQKTDNPVDPINAVNKEKIQEVINMAGRSGSMVDAYDMLTSAEKASLWTSHLDSFLLKASLDSSQIALLDS